MKFNKIIGALALIGVSSGVMAATWGVHDASEYSQTLVTGVAAASAVKDVFSFSLLGNNNVTTTSFTFPIATYTLVDAKVELFSGNAMSSVSLGSFSVDPFLGGSKLFSNLSAGNYFYEVTGLASNAGAYYYSLSSVAVSAPVPEPEGYAMLLAGLGLIGMIARRRMA